MNRKPLLLILSLFGLLISSCGSNSSCPSSSSISRIERSSVTTQDSSIYPESSFSSSSESLSSSEESSSISSSSKPIEELLTFYLLDNETYGVGIGNDKNITSITIPEKYNDVPVTSIVEKGFSGCLDLRYVNIPNSVTSLGEGAFRNCCSLENINMPTDLVSIGMGAFTGCIVLPSLYFTSSLVSIGNYAFTSCSSLSIYFEAPSKPARSQYYWNDSNCPVVFSCIKYGEYDNFKYGVCGLENKYITISGLVDKSVTSVVIPCFLNIDGENIDVTAIAANAFYSNSILTSIIIPNCITFIGEYAFFHCPDLTIYCEATSEPEGWNMFWSDSFCPKVWAYTGAFHELDNYKYCICTLGDHKFITITGLIDRSVTSITFPSSIKVDGEDIPVSAIADNAFTKYTSLQNVVIPNNITSIGIAAFYLCSSIETITVPYVGGSRDNNTNFGYIFGADGYASNDQYVPKSLKKVFISEGCTYIDDKAFWQCRDIEYVTIPDTVTSIGESAFEDCYSLISVLIPDSVISIGTWAFKNCSVLAIYCEAGSQPEGWSLSWVIGSVPVVWSSIDYGIYNNIKYGICSENSNKYITIAGLLDKSVASLDIPSFITVDKEDIYVTGISNYAFIAYSHLESIHLPSCVTSIGDCAFQSCLNLQSINLPRGLTSIGLDAFWACDLLSSIIIPNTVNFIGNGSFKDCLTLTIYCEATTQPEGWDPNWRDYKVIVVWSYLDGYDVFGNFKYSVCGSNEDKFITISGLVDTSVTSITIPSTIKVDGIDIPVTTLADSAFYGCSSLNSVHLPDSITSISCYCFYQCSSLLSIIIPDGVTSIGENAFAFCSSLRSANIPDGVTVINGRTFCRCISLETLYLPNSIEVIGGSAFEDCISLTSINIPSSVYYIGRYAFSDCSSLTSIFIPGSVVYMGSSAFDRCYKLIIYCGYKKAPEGWELGWSGGCRVEWND